MLLQPCRLSTSSRMVGRLAANSCWVLDFSEMDLLPGRLILLAASGSRFQECSAMGRFISRESSRQMGASKAPTVAWIKATSAILVLVAMACGRLNLPQQDNQQQF